MKDTAFLCGSQLKEICAILCGLVVATDYREGQL